VSVPPSPLLCFALWSLRLVVGMDPPRDAAQLYLRLMLRRPRSGRLEARGGPASLLRHTRLTASPASFGLNPPTSVVFVPSALTQAPACPRWSGTVAKAVSATVPGLQRIISP